jgi:hypothetical protein
MDADSSARAARAAARAAARDAVRAASGAGGAGTGVAAAGSSAGAAGAAGAGAAGAAAGSSAGAAAGAAGAARAGAGGPLTITSLGLTELELNSIDVLVSGYEAFGSARNPGLVEEILYALYISIVHCGRTDLLNEFIVNKDTFLSGYTGRQIIINTKKLEVGLPILKKLTPSKKQFDGKTITKIISTTQRDDIGKTADVLLVADDGEVMGISVKNYTGKSFCVKNPSGASFGITKEIKDELYRKQKEEITKLQTSGEKGTTHLCEEAARLTVETLHRTFPDLSSQQKLASDVIYATDEYGEVFKGKPADYMVAFKINIKTNVIQIKHIKFEGGISESLRRDISSSSSSSSSSGATPPLATWSSLGIYIYYSAGSNVYIKIQVKPNNGVRSLTGPGSIFSSWNSVVFHREAFNVKDIDNIKLH